MTGPKRARRRHDLARMKAKALRLGRAKDIPDFDRYADYLAVCSCHLCRNPRHSNFSKGPTRLTIQERRAPSVTL